MLKDLVKKQANEGWSGHVKLMSFSQHGQNENDHSLAYRPAKAKHPVSATFEVIATKIDQEPVLFQRL